METIILIALSAVVTVGIYLALFILALAVVVTKDLIKRHRAMVHRKTFSPKNKNYGKFIRGEYR